MTEWLLDDTQWQAPQQDGKEMFLKQCGLLLFAHYRWQLGLYLRRLEDGCPGTVPAAVFETLERIGAARSGRARIRFVAARGGRPCAGRFFGNAQPSFARKDG